MAEEPKFIPTDPTYLTAEQLAERTIPITPNGWRREDERAIAQSSQRLRKFLEARKE